MVSETIHPMIKANSNKNKKLIDNLHVQFRMWSTGHRCNVAFDSTEFLKVNNFNVHVIRLLLIETFTQLECLSLSESTTMFVE